MKNRFFTIALILLSAGILTTSAIGAEDFPDSEPQTSQPAQPQSAVARISVIHGDVSTMRGDAGQWVAATVNTPLVPGDQVATSDRARAEVQLDYANVIRLEQHTDAKVADLEQNKLQIQLASGLIDFTAFKDTQTDAEIDTPNMGVHLLSPGVFRIEVDSPTETLLIVRQGEAEVLTNQGSTKVEAGQVIQIHGSDNPEYKIDPAPGGDEFDKWCANRDHQIQTAQAWQHTSPEVTGSGDLDQYGQWEQVPDYGWCWTPEVDAGWVPYSAGRWGWEPYWGWTWISYEPWGWAPYHYGRWFMYGGRWAWWPAVGFYGPHAIWAPAYVSFFGFGGGFGVGFGFGSIGWLALGPRDVFHPWFGAGHSFSVVGFDRFHGAGFTTPGGRPFGSNLERAFSDERMRGAIMHVSAQDFANGRVTRSGPVSESMLRSASMVRGTLPVVPTQASLGNRVSNFSGYRGLGSSNQHFFSRGGASSATRSYNFNSEANQVLNMVQRGPSREASLNGRTGGSYEGYGSRGNSTYGGRAESGQPGGAGGNYNWQGVGRGNQSERWPSAVNGGSTGPGRTSAGPQATQNDWHRYASPSPYGGGRGNSAEPAQRGGWQNYSNGTRSYSGGGNGGRSYGGGWNAPAPRSGGSYYGGGSRPPMELNRPIMRQRAPSGGSYGGGGRSYSAPSGGNHSNGEGNHSYGGGGGHSSGGGGGGHSSGGGHGGGRR